MKSISAYWREFTVEKIDERLKPYYLTTSSNFSMSTSSNQNYKIYEKFIESESGIKNLFLFVWHIELLTSTVKWLQVSYEHGRAMMNKEMILERNRFQPWNLKLERLKQPEMENMKKALKKLLHVFPWNKSNCCWFFRLNYLIHRPCKVVFWCDMIAVLNEIDIFIQNWQSARFFV